MYLLFQRLFSWWKANGIPQEVDGWEECEPAARPVPYAMWLPGPLWCLCETQAISVPWMLEVLCWLLLAAYASLAISFYQIWPVCLAEQPACPTQGAPALSLNEVTSPIPGTLLPSTSVHGGDSSLPSLQDGVCCAPTLVLRLRWGSAGCCPLKTRELLPPQSVRACSALQASQPCLHPVNLWASLV